MVKFTKKALTLKQQVELLVSRGMGGDPAEIERCLQLTNYYRLSAYWFTFRKQDETRKIHYDEFQPGTLFEVVWDRYCFDRQLRLLVMDAIERIEVVVRAALAYWHSHEHGPFGYVTDPRSLPSMSDLERQDFLRRVEEESTRSKRYEDFGKHFKNKYGDLHDCLPVWMATEGMSFRTMLMLFRNCTRRVKKNVAEMLDMPDTVVASWLDMLNIVRNVCAHHGRLWNRTLNAPSIPTGEKYKVWNTPVLIRHDKMFAVLTVLNYCAGKISTDSALWASRFNALLREHPHVPIRYMGFPDNWKTSPLWTGADTEA